MPHSMSGGDANGARIILGLLESVERDGAQSQRRLATELGIALGLVNAYVKRCVKKGLLKVRHTPKGRYAYYLTRRGFSEKSRLTFDFLVRSFSFIRQARADCARTFDLVRAQGFSRVVLAGRSDFTEIAAVCSLESGIRIVAVVDGKSGSSTFLNIPVVPTYAQVAAPFDAIVVTDLLNAGAAAIAAAAVLDADHVFIPHLLETRLSQPRTLS